MIARPPAVATSPLALAARLAVVLIAPACGSDSPADKKSQVASAMQASMVGDLMALHQASIDLQAAAPTPAGRGWDATVDAAAIAAMKAAWVRARTAYEHAKPPKYFVTIFQGVHPEPFENTPSSADDMVRESTVTFWRAYLLGDDYGFSYLR